MNKLFLFLFVSTLLYSNNLNKDIENDKNKTIIINKKIYCVDKNKRIITTKQSRNLNIKKDNNISKINDDKICFENFKEAENKLKNINKFSFFQAIFLLFMLNLTVFFLINNTKINNKNSLIILFFTLCIDIYIIFFTYNFFIK